MTTATGQHRGVVEAFGFFFDLSVLGETKARDRVLSVWRSGATLSHMAGGWVLLLPGPVLARTERAPGLPLVASGGGYAGPGAVAESESVSLLVGGRLVRTLRRDLEPVAFAHWFDLTALEIHHLYTCDAPTPRPPTIEEARRPDPKLRTLAGVDHRRARRRRRFHWPWSTSASKWHGSGSSRQVRPIVLFLIPIVLAGIVALIWHSAIGHGSPAANQPTAPTAPPPTHTSTSPTNDGSGDFGLQNLIPIIAIVIWAVLRFASRRSSPTSGTEDGTAKSSSWIKRLSWLMMRTPARSVVGRKHERYLRRLTRQFEHRNWDDALHEAIALGGSGGGMNLRLPKRRESLAFGSISGSGGSIYYGDTVYQHLREMYRRAAEELEGDGRIREAAFAHADLLHDANAAVALLERHGELTLAAELSEARKLDVNLTVRLWWRAGRRDRAVDLARVRGAFAGAILRLREVDPDGALALRREWVRTCQAAGDHYGAVDAAWPDPELRRDVEDDMHVGIALGGAERGELLAKLLMVQPDASSLAGAHELLHSASTEGRPARFRFRSAWADNAVADKTTDRSIATEALRAELRDGFDDRLGTKRTHREQQALRHRADPLLVADLPAPRRSKSRPRSPLALCLDDRTGALPILEAVAINRRAILLALGNVGARLMSLDGRTLAHWDVPTHRLVVADSRGSALLIRDAGSDQEIHRLDMVTRKVRPWTTLHVPRILRSFDGATLTTHDKNGLAFIDTLAETPKIIWRELDRDHRIIAVERTPTNLTAVVDCPPAVEGAERQKQVFSWELPSLTLRVRRNVDFDETAFAVGVLPGELLLLGSRKPGDLTLRRYRGYENPSDRTNIDSVMKLHTTGSSELLYKIEDCGALDMVINRHGRHVATVTVPEFEWFDVREHSDLLTLSDSNGRVAVIDVNDWTLVARCVTKV